MNSSIIKILIYLILFAVLFVAYVRVVEMRTVFFPDKHIVATPKDVGIAYEDVYFKTQDGFVLNGWLIKSSQSPESRATFIFSHGNAGNISGRLEKIMMLHRLGVNIFIFDYRGYGKSEGRPTEKGMYLDAMAAFDHLKERSDISKDKLISYGVSLGGAAAVDLAVRRPVAALIVESTITSAADMSKKILPIVPAFVLSLKLDSISKIKDIKVPKLIAHSPEDEMIPFVFGQKLFEAAASPKEFLELQGDHNSGFALSQDILLQGLQGFLEKYDLI